jgi:hypothetical protein
MKKWFDRFEMPSLLAVPAIAMLVAGAILGVGLAVAQIPGLYIASPTGLEQINVTVQSVGGLPVTNPQIETVTINQISNASGYVTAAAGTTVTTAMANTQSYAIATGAITTWNITLPTAPYDRELVRVACPGGNTGTLTISATLPTGVAITGVNPTSCTESSGGATSFIYSLSANVWYRV